MTGSEILARYFPTVMPEADFVRRTQVVLNSLRMNADNSLACVCTCRDELCQPLGRLIRDAWGEAFNLSGLGGMFFAGATALRAAMLHAPNADGRERYIFFALAHLAIDAEGKIGDSKRAGRNDVTRACGALDAFQIELARGTFALIVDPYDVEQSWLKERLARETMFGQPPDLLTLTKIAQRASQHDLEQAIVSVIDSKVSDYALITGIQLHTEDGNYVSPVSFYAVIAGARHELEM